MSFASESEVEERTGQLFRQLHPEIPNILREMSIEGTFRKFLPPFLRPITSRYQIEKNPNVPGHFSGLINFQAPQIGLEIAIRPYGETDTHVIFICSRDNSAALNLAKQISEVPPLKERDTVIFTIPGI